KGGGEIVELLGTSAWYAPGAAAAQMVDSVMLDEKRGLAASAYLDGAAAAPARLVASVTPDGKRVLPCTASLEGEYGIDGLYMGVPVKLGRGGIEEVVELELSEDEQRMLNEAADACGDGV